MQHPKADAVVILCAGGSQRMGQPKGLLNLDGRPLLLHHVDAFEAYAGRIIVVLGAEAARYRRRLPSRVCVVENLDWKKTWPSDSLRLAIRREAILGPCWVTPVDVPPAQRATLDALHRRGPPAVPVDDHGRPGHPVLLGTHQVAAVQRLAPIGGLRSLLSDAPRVRVGDPDLALDFDEPARWHAYAARYRSKGRCT